jgi:hypothetical protein
MDDSSFSSKNFRLSTESYDSAKKDIDFSFRKYYIFKYLSNKN